MKLSEFKLLVEAAQKTADDEKPNKALNAILKDCHEKIKEMDKEIERRKGYLKEEIAEMRKRMENLDHEEIYLGNGEDDDF